MNRIMRKYLMVVFILLLLSACSSAPVELNSSIVRTPLLPTSTTAHLEKTQSIATVTPIPSPEPTLSPTIALEVEVSPLNISEEDVRFQTLDVLTALPTSSEIAGTFVLKSVCDASNCDVFLYTVRNENQVTLLDDGGNIGSVAISPDRKWLAYSKGGVLVDEENVLPDPMDLAAQPPYWEGRNLIVVDLSHQNKIEISYQEGWGAISQWKDNDNLIIRRALEKDNWYSSYTARLVLNPFAGETLELPPEPLDIFSLYPVPEWRGLGMISYDPTLTRRVYPNNQYELVLENLQTHEILSHILAPIWDSVPRWSPDGEMFVITNDENLGSGQFDYELYAVTYDGQIDKLTNLATYYEETFIDYYTWSPNGGKIAFWVSFDKSIFPMNLAILDMNLRQVTIYQEMTSNYGYPPEIIWSPDGNQILTGTTSLENERTILIDLDENWVFQIMDGTTPIGWMIP